MPDCLSEARDSQHTVVCFPMKTFRNHAFEWGLKGSKKMRLYWMTLLEYYEGEKSIDLILYADL